MAHAFSKICIIPTDKTSQVHGFSPVFVDPEHRNLRPIASLLYVLQPTRKIRSFDSLYCFIPKQTAKAYGLPPVHIISEQKKIKSIDSPLYV